MSDSALEFLSAAVWPAEDSWPPTQSVLTRAASRNYNINITAARAAKTGTESASAAAGHVNFAILRSTAAPCGDQQYRRSCCQSTQVLPQLLLLLHRADLRRVQEKGSQRQLVLGTQKPVLRPDQRVSFALQTALTLGWLDGASGPPCFSWRALASCMQLQTSRAMHRTALSCRILSIIAC